jgi:hypothetical protein
MKDRGMKKWAPYASLIEQKGTVQEMKGDKRKVQKPLLSQEQAEDINRFIVQLKKGQSVRITYYNDGIIQTIQGVIHRLDFDAKTLIIEGAIIFFRQITAIA